MAQVATAPAEQESNDVHLMVNVVDGLEGEYFVFENLLLIRGRLPKKRIMEIVEMRLDDAERAREMGRW